MQSLTHVSHVSRPIARTALHITQATRTLVVMSHATLVLRTLLTASARPFSSSCSGMSASSGTFLRRLPVDDPGGICRGV